VVETVPSQGHETILLVEDETSVRDLTMRVLSDAGYRVLSASAPKAAIKTATGYPDRIHLLVTDVVMPEMSGPVLAQQLGQARPDMLVLFISGFSGESMAALEPFGQDRLLSKPFTPASLVARVRDVLGSARA
jgi:DNA-binding response OmpR family regulator